MEFIVFLIIAIVVLMIFHFIKDSYSESNSVAKEGGIRIKYKTLIDHFICPEEGLNVLSETNTYVCVGTKNAAGSMVFHFQHTFKKINVTFKLNNVFLGNHKLEWDFPETMPQEDMIRHIETKTRSYMDNVSAKYL